MARLIATIGRMISIKLDNNLKLMLEVVAFCCAQIKKRVLSFLVLM